MNRQIRVLSVITMLLFFALMLNASYLQFWQSKDLSSLAKHPDNKRIRDYQFSQERGAILVAGQAIAESVPTNDGYRYQRRYPFKNLYSPIVGYYTRDYGLGGIEASQNTILNGTDDRLFVNRVIDMFNDKSQKGGNVTLTLNPDAQKAAFAGLQKLGPKTKGAVVALEPTTGKILAMVSNPNYDPNRLATHNFSAASQTKAELLNSSSAPLQNRAIEELLPPGSTFKVVTTAAALSNKFDPDSLVPGGATLQLPLTNKVLTNFSGDCGGANITLTRALMVSCNVGYGALGLRLGPAKMRKTANAFGFGKRYFSELDDPLTKQAISRFPKNLTKRDKPLWAYTAIGQYEVAATPLQMAMVAAGVANSGDVMRPYLVDEVQSSEFEMLEKTEPEILNNAALSPAQAGQLSEMMTEVVANGTGSAAQIPGIKVAGKTGTAQSAPNRPAYAWFISFAPVDNPKVAVAVLVQDAGVARNAITGNGLAAPIAKAVMEAVIK